jgi:prepilin-type N-terminal cleavage/methylation domain-containing protein
MTAAPRRRTAGFTLLELLIVVTLAGVLLAASVPPILDASRQLRLTTAAAEVARTLHLARSYAVRHSAHVGVRFTTDPSGSVTWVLYRDGDGDGVLSRDVASGRDPAVGPAGRTLAHFGRGVRFGFPATRPLRDPAGRRLDRFGDPIRFNRSDIASFGPTGTATPGTLYLTAGRGSLACVRVTSRTGRVRVMVREPETGRWR